MPHDALAESGDEELVDRAREGDDKAIETLLHRYRHYARAKARSYFLAGADREDIVQEGMIGLYKAIRDFQADRNTAFRAFAELCITRQDRKSTRLNSSHANISYAVFCLKKKL